MGTKGPLEVRSDVDALISELRGLDDGDVWMVGGGQLQMAFLERGALDEIEIYIIPEMLGGGRPLFPPTGFRTSPTLVSAQALDRGCVRLHYRF
jgi:dihydrofolate reductase